MIRAVRHVVRLFGIAHRLGQYDALFLLERFGIAPTVTAAAGLFARRPRGIAALRPGQRLALAIQGLGPSFIKFGQILSTRSDLLGEEIATDLAELQDSLPPFSGAEARAIIAREFGRPLETLFAQFDEVPVAAASIAQVHMAVTADGREVAVKVLRPGIEEAFTRDLGLFFWLATIAEGTGPRMRRLRPIEVVQTMADTVAIIESGRVVQQGPPSAIYMRPATPFVAGLFGPLNRLTGRVQGGRVSTPLGVFEAAHLAEGAAVQVLIRHEALRLADAPLTDGAMCLAPRPARLLAARLIGRATHLRLQATEGGIELQARIPGTVDAVPGRDVMLAVDRARAFVFAE